MRAILFSENSVFTRDLFSDTFFKLGSTITCMWDLKSGTSIRRVCVIRENTAWESVPEIHQHVADALSNQQTKKRTAWEIRSNVKPVWQRSVVSQCSERLM